MPAFFFIFFYPFSRKPEAPAGITARKKGELWNESCERKNCLGFCLKFSEFSDFWLEKISDWQTKAGARTQWKSGTGPQHMRAVALKAARNIWFFTILIPSEGGSIPNATLEMHQSWWVVFITLFASFQPLYIAASDSSFCCVSELRSFSSFGTRTRSHLPARWVESERGFAASSCWELDAPLARPATWLASKWFPRGATCPNLVPQLPSEASAPISGADTGSYRDHALAAPEKGKCVLAFPINWIN